MHHRRQHAEMILTIQNMNIYRIKIIRSDWAWVIAWIGLSNFRQEQRWIGSIVHQIGFHTEIIQKKNEKEKQTFRLFLIGFQAHSIPVRLSQCFSKY